MTRKCKLYLKGRKLCGFTIEFYFPTLNLLNLIKINDNVFSKHLFYWDL